MNHPSEWQKIYHPKIGKYVYKHKGTGVITDSLFSIGRNLKKPILAIVKKTAEETGGKIAIKAVKKAGDKIGNILRKRSSETGSRRRPSEAEGKKRKNQAKWERRNDATQ